MKKHSIKKINKILSQPLNNLLFKAQKKHKEKEKLYSQVNENIKQAN